MRLGKYGMYDVSFRGFFKDKRILVTGHTGFKGAWLTRWLLNLGAEVHGFSLPPNSETNLYEKLRLDQDIESSVLADIKDFDNLSEVVQSIQPDIIFHLAAQALVGESYLNPRSTYETNVMGTLNLLEAVRLTPSVKVVQVVTSDKCYENRNWVHPYRENDPMGGYDPYSSSKGCVELLVSSFRNSFFSDSQSLSLATVRAGNVFGGGDWSRGRVIPDCVSALREGIEIEIRNPDAVRPWQHVLEPLSGYLWLAYRQATGGRDYSTAWNFGPQAFAASSVRNIVEKIINVWGQGSWRLVEGDLAVHEANTLRLDTTKANTLLSWFPIYDLEHAVEETVEWYKRDLLAEGDAVDFTDYQIQQYTKMARERNLDWAAVGNAE
jgi:CDP-glucose 4,6-dehydratase